MTASPLELFYLFVMIELAIRALYELFFLCIKITHQIPIPMSSSMCYFLV